MLNRDPALGDQVRNKITGFTGIVTVHSKALAGCDRLWVEPKVGADNKPVEGQWVDIDLLEIVTPEALAPVAYARRAPGGFDLPKPR